MHLNPVKRTFKKNNLFQHSCFAAHVNSVLHPTNNYEFNLKCIFYKIAAKFSYTIEWQVSSRATHGGSVCSVTLGILLRGT